MGTRPKRRYARRAKKRAYFELPSYIAAREPKTAFLTAGRGGRDNIIDDVLWNWGPGKLINQIPGAENFAPGAVSAAIANKVTGQNLKIPSRMRSEDAAAAVLGSADTAANQAAADTYDIGTAPARALADGMTWSFSPVPMALGGAVTTALDTARPWASRLGSVVDGVYQRAGLGQGATSWSANQQRGLNALYDWAGRGVDPKTQGTWGGFFRRFADPYVKSFVGSNLTNTGIGRELDQQAASPSSLQTPQTTPASYQSPSPPLQNSGSNWMSAEEIGNFVGEKPKGLR